MGQSWEEDLPKKKGGIFEARSKKGKRERAAQQFSKKAALLKRKPPQGMWGPILRTPKRNKGSREGAFHLFGTETQPNISTLRGGA